MAKRLFSADKRAEKILSHLRENNGNLSAFISDAVIDEVLPVYSQLRIEALYLLDYIIDGAKEWTGNKLILATGEDELIFYIRQTLGRGVSWLNRNHHIRNGEVLKELISYYYENPCDGGIDMDNVNDYVKANIKKVQEKFKVIDPKYKCLAGLGSLARDVIDCWDKFWDDSDAYDLILSVILQENLRKNFDPIVVIKMLQTMENQFILEAIGERPR